MYCKSSFAPYELATAIQKYVPGFKVSYKADFRQGIANGWPASIDDRQAREEWGWKPAYDLQQMTEDMLGQLGRKKGIEMMIHSPEQEFYPDGH